MTCLSGGRAFIDVGTEVPYADWFLTYGVHHGYFEASIAWKQVGSRLLIEPTAVGDGRYIRVKVTPEFSYFVGGNSLTTVFAAASTEVTAADGTEFRIGGGDQHQEFYSKFLIGFDTSGKMRALDIILRPRILEP